MNIIQRIAALLAASLFVTGAAHAKDLVGVYEDALQNDPQIRQANANRLASREARPQAWASLLPQLSALASRQQDKQSGTQGFLNFDPVTGTYFALPTPFGLNSTQKTWSVNLRESLFSWSNWMTLKEADRQVAEAEATYLAAQQNLILRVAQAYFNVLSAQDGLDANQASLEAIQRQLDQADKRFEVGLIAITDVQEAKAARDTAAAAVIAAKRTLATAGDQLSEVTGQKYDRLSKPGEDMPLTPPEPASEEKWVDASMDQNPTLLSSRLAADVARDNVRVAFGGHLPTLDLIASKSRTQTSSDESVLGSNPFTLDSNVNDRQYTLQITVPIFSGGLTQSRVRQSQYEWIAAKEQVVQSSRATERQARDAYLGVISGIARVQALRQALQSSETALKATEAGYEVGTRTAVDVLNARRTLVQAQTDYAGSRYDYIVSVIQLRLAAGSLSRNDVAEINNWLAVTAPTEPAQPIVPPEQSQGAPPPAPPQSPAPPATPQSAIPTPSTPAPTPGQPAAPQPAPSTAPRR
ncbi:MAG TPA: TolC family outer membrane protein [Steroidobacteraceae bacterium]|nr:TolC family outer membrane protein [Steroidobacteraceae bacterium]